jgi:hypothetical protein
VCLLHLSTPFARSRHILQLPEFNSFIDDPFLAPHADVFAQGEPALHVVGGNLGRAVKPKILIEGVGISSALFPSPRRISGCPIDRSHVN